MSWKRFAVVAFALVAMVLLSCQMGWSQATNATGSIEGTVTDAQGGVIPNAKVTLSRADTGQVLPLTTTSSGSFSSGPLLAGNYAVRVEAASFKSYNTSAVVLVGQITTVNAKLELGASSTIVEVTGQSVSVNTEQEQVSGTLTAQQIENLPVNGRNFLDLAQLEPGVQIQDGGNFDPTKIGFSSISFGGKFGRSARISVDGVDVSDENVGTTTTGLPSSAIQEFQVAQSGLDISNDLTSGGAVNVVTKSGTNMLHGDAFGLFRDSSEAAAYPGGAAFQRSQYGGDVGGAVIKDKLFFFADAERLLAHDKGGVLIANIPSGISGDSTNLNSFTGTFPAPFHDNNLLGKVDYQISKNVRAFGRFGFWQASDVGNFGGAANYSVYDNKDRTKTIVGGLDISQGTLTHSFRAEYLKFVNVIADSVVGSNLPLADLPTSIVLSGTGLATGPSDLAPQSTIQSDRQVKYDGSKVWGSHILRWGADYNRIMGWTFASFFGISPVSESLTLNADTGPNSVTCPGGQTGAACPLNYYPDLGLVGNGEGSFTELQRFGKSSGGLGPDNRIGLYIGDSWKVKPNLTFNYALRYDRDTGRTDSDLGPLAGVNAYFPGYGDAVRNPNKNFAPQVGFAWDPKSNAKMVIRGGVGIYYDNTVFNDVLFDRLLRLPNGAFNIVQTACAFGGPGAVTFGGSAGDQTIGGGSSAAGGVICGTPIGETVGAGGGNCAGETFAACLAAFQTADQASWAANPTGPNGAYMPAVLSAGGLASTGLLDPNYKSPRSIQMNIGIQRQLTSGMVFSADFVRNVSLHYLLATDINHSGDVSLFNPTLGANAVANTLAACGVGTIDAAIAACPGLHPGTGGAPAGPATMADFAGNFLDSAYDVGLGACPTCAFQANNPAVGNFYMYHSGGRSVYNGVDLKLVQNVRDPFRGIKYLNFQATYTLSRYVNAGSTGSGTDIAGGDADFVNNAISNRNPLALMGPGSLDRTHQFNFGGYGDLPGGFRLGLISHFWSPLAGTPTVLPVAGSGQSGATGGIFTSDFIGSGQIGNPLPKSQTSSTCGDVGGTCNYDLYNIGAFMRQIGPAGLSSAITSYDHNIGGVLPTPAGQALINSGLFTLTQLQELGGVAAPVAASPAGAVGYGWLKTFDVEFSWVGHLFNERLSIQPSVSLFNVFNFANFDSAANALTGQLNGGPGSINGTVQAGRPDRIGAGTGVFAFGAPRTVEWGLKLSF
ncbi:MAG: carboxypeptidase regulatory-like domain-containing protein [Candidatus Acidiferrales bacterium]